jgi:hypothetical protein
MTPELKHSVISIVIISRGVFIFNKAANVFFLKKLASIFRCEPAAGNDTQRGYYGH